MIQELPTRGFNWVDDDNVSKLTPDESDRLTKDDSRGYLLEVDVKHPKELHDLHNDLLFMCEKMVINRVEKLVCNSYDQKNYVIHIRASDQALKHGSILEKVHHVIGFNQSTWLKPYIDFNTKLERRQRTISKKTSLSL